MGIKNNVINGFTMDKNGNREIINAHISYKGRSVIIDYEYILHAYSLPQSNMYVPFEMYPYNGGDIYNGVVSLDQDFGYADIGELLTLLDNALEREGEMNGSSEEDME